MPELRELCATPDLALFVEHVKEDAPVILSLAERSDVGSTPISSRPLPNPDALFAEEICDLLSKLDVAIPGLGRAIACLLTGTAIKDESKKVGDCPRADIRKKKKTLRCKDNKSGAIEKMPAAL
jgi:hypothetical protein